MSSCRLLKEDPIFYEYRNVIEAPPVHDVTIVGAGAVGLYLASLLVNTGLSVLVIESGADSIRSFDPSTYSASGFPHDGIRTSRCAGLGGTTNLWGGQLAEFSFYDFLPSANTPNWPVSFEIVQQYYQRVYKDLDISFTSDEEIRGSLGLNKLSGSGLEHFYTRWLREPSFARRYRETISKSALFNVVLNCTVREINCSSVGDADSLAVVGNEGASTWGVERLVLAAGTIETTRLLLASARSENSASCLKNPNIGAYFQDHLGGRVATIQPVNHKRFLELFGTVVMKGEKLQPKLRPQGEESLCEGLNIHGFFGFDSNISEQLVYLRQFVRALQAGRRPTGVSDFFVNLGSVGRYVPALIYRYLRDHRVFVPSSSSISLQVQSEQYRTFESRITLKEGGGGSADSMPLNLHWNVTGDERYAIADFVRRVDDLLRTSGLGRVDMDHRLLDESCSLASLLRDTGHQAGGTVMSSSADTGVVNEDLLVHGSSNIWIIGASTFPRSSGANTTLTALAFAARLADGLGATHA